MPFNDPHTAAPSLWAWADAEGMSFECSAASMDLPAPKRKALECYLLWQYRLEQGESTLCNHGRFHPRYRKSLGRNTGVRGSRIPDGEPDNVAGGPSVPPLPPGQSTRANIGWNTPEALSPEAIADTPASPGVYRILDMAAGETVYIGESRNLKDRLRSHQKRQWHCPAGFSYLAQPTSILPHQLKEMENDLIGRHFGHSGTPPRFQFGAEGG